MEKKQLNKFDCAIKYASKFIFTPSTRAFSQESVQLSYYPKQHVKGVWNTNRLLSNQCTIISRAVCVGVKLNNGLDTM